MTITTNTGKVFPISWAGISGRDGTLCISVKNIQFLEAVTIFNNPEETKKLYYSMDEGQLYIQEYDGFTVLTGINRQSEDYIVNLVQNKGGE